MNSPVKATLLTAIVVLVVMSSVITMAGVDATDGTGTGQGDTSSVDVSDIFSKGQGSEIDPYIIADADALMSFRDSVNVGNSYDGQYISLDPTVVYDVSGSQWEPIGITVANGDGTYDDNPFKGVFDGNGATVSGITMTESNITSYRGMDTRDYYAYGFFGGVVDGSVKNISFTDFDIVKPGPASQNSVTAVAVGALLFSGEVSGIHVGDGSVTGVSRVAGVVGYIGGAKIGNDGPANTDGAAMGTITVSGNTNDADMTSEWTTSSHGTAAGIIATTNLKSMTGGSYVISGNTNNGDLCGYYSAGILASGFSSSTTHTISDNRNTGTISTQGDDNTLEFPMAAGILVSTGVNFTVSDNTNSGNVTSGNSVASGIAATLTGGTISGCLNTGMINGYVQAAGIVAGMTGGTISDCENLGAVSSECDDGSVIRAPNEQNSRSMYVAAGGIVAYLSAGASFDGATNRCNAEVSSVYGTDGKIVGMASISTVSNITVDDGLGSIRVLGNGAYTITLNNLKQDEVGLVAGHTQNFVFTIKMDSQSSIGTLQTIEGVVHTGMTVAISGGSIGTMNLGMTNNSGGLTSTSIIASDGATIGSIDMAGSISDLYIAALEGSAIGSVENEDDIVIGVSEHDNGDSKTTYANKGSIDSAISATKVSLANVGEQEQPTYSVYSGNDQTVLESFSSGGTQVGIMNAVSSESLFTDGTVSSAPNLRDGVKVFIPSDTTLTLNAEIPANLLVGQDSTSKITIEQGGSYGDLTEEGTYGWADSGQGGVEPTKVVSVTVRFPAALSIDDIEVTVPVGSTIDVSIVDGLPAGFVVTGLTVDGQEFTGPVNEDMAVDAIVTLTEPTVDYVLDVGVGQSTLTVYATHPLGDGVNFTYSLEGPESISNNNGVFEISMAGTYSLTVDIALDGDESISASVTKDNIVVEVADDTVSYDIIVQGYLTEDTTTFDMNLVVPEGTTVICSSSDTYVATITNSGIITFVGEGDTNITLSITGPTVSISEEFTFNVVDVRGIIDVTLNPVTDKTFESMEPFQDDIKSSIEGIEPMGVAVLDINGTASVFTIPFHVLGWDIGAFDYDEFDYLVFHFPDDGRMETVDVTATSDGLIISVDSFSPFLFYFAQKAADSSPGPSWDEEETLPPFINRPESGDDDTVTIVACAAAAVVAALMAVFLVLTYRKD